MQMLSFHKRSKMKRKAANAYLYRGVQKDKTWKKKRLMFYTKAMRKEATKKQLEYIEELRENSDMSLRPFTGTTKREADEYIANWNTLALNRWKH